VLVEAIAVDNALQNVHHLVACPRTGRALAIDPLDVDAALERARARGFTIEGILLTHEHWDHAQGRAAMRKATGAPVLAHQDSPLDGVDRRLRDGELLAVGEEVALRVLDTPGHTRAHVCLLGHGHLFSGDTVFVAGCGNCRNGGDPALLFRTFQTRIAPLDPATRLVPGHDYAVNNLRFALDREPGNAAARAALSEAEACTARGEVFATDLAQERRINPFLRLRDPALRDRLGLSADAADADVFLALRSLRNDW
jgi:hydroxyacylglutathione hydrolase